MSTRNRNTAIALIAAGFYLLLGKLFGFFAVASLIFIALGYYRVRMIGDKIGYIAFGVGLLMLLSDNFSLVLALLLIVLGYFYLKSNQALRNHVYMKRHKIVESIRFDQEPWLMQSMNIWNVVGEIRFDLSLGIIEEQEVKLVMQGVVGNIDIIVPMDIGLSVEASILFGKIQAPSQDKVRGAFNKLVWQSPNYEASDRKVKLFVNYIVGDMDIKLV